MSFSFAEGFATTKSVEILLDKPAIMAVDSESLISLYEALLEKYPQIHIVKPSIAGRW